MGQLVEFQAAKDRILGVNQPAEKDGNLASALEQFSFSRLPQRERVARVLHDVLSPTGIRAGFEFSEKVLLLLADALEASIENGFSKPYEPLAVELSIEAVEPFEA